MTGLEKFRKMAKVSQYIDSHLESLARIVEGTDSRTNTWIKLTSDLKELFPQDDADSLAQALVTEQCRVEFLKMKAANRPAVYSGGRD
jgi:hypothetical protein